MLKREYLTVLLWNEDIPLDLGVVGGKNVMYSAWMLEVLGLPGGPVVKNACNAGDGGSIPESGRCPGEGNGNPLQYSCLENPMDRGAWWATVHGVRHDLVTEHACILIKGFGLTTQIIEIEGWFDHPDNWDNWDKIKTSDAARKNNSIYISTPVLFQDDSQLEDRQHRV